MRTMPFPKTTRGFAIFEIMIALVVGVALATTAMVVFGTTIGSGRVMQAQAWISQTADKTKQSYASSPDFMTVTQASAITDGLFPAASMTGAGNAPVNPWGGDFTVTAVDTDEGPSTGIAVIIDQVPAAECVKLAAVMAPTSYILINGVQVAADGHAAPDVNALAVMCDNGGDAGARMQFDYAKR
jgi:Tfp pilus assembly protein PilE